MYSMLAILSVTLDLQRDGFNECHLRATLGIDPQSSVGVERGVPGFPAGCFQVLRWLGHYFTALKVTVGLPPGFLHSAICGMTSARPSSFPESQVPALPLFQTAIK